MSAASPFRSPFGLSTPALLTSMSNSTSAASFVRAAVSLTSSAWGMQPVRSASVGERVGGAGEGVDLEPFAAQALDHGGADAGGGAGDESGPVIGERHGHPLSVGAILVRIADRAKTDCLEVISGPYVRRAALFVQSAKPA